LEKYSDNRFHIALDDILREKNVKLRGLASRTNLNYTYFSKLKARKKSPPIRTIEIIARGLNVPPEYFLEYRIHQVTDFLSKNPEFLEPVLSFIKTLQANKGLKVAEDRESFESG
jgi:transcriptional regulator with XRE-family HTH domain